MQSLLCAMAVLVVFGTLAYGVIQSLVLVWLDHRLKLTLLGKLEKAPDVFRSPDEIQSLLSGLATSSSMSKRQDYCATGTVLGCIGLLCVIAGKTVRIGQLAVGVYLGGLICVFIGLVLFLVGVLIRSLSKPTPPAKARDVS